MRKLITFFSFLMAAALLHAQEVKPSPVIIPESSVSLLDFGGVPDGVELNTAAFSRAFEALEKQGGGHLVVPAGIFLTGPIKLPSSTDLHLERGAVILFSPDKKDFFDGKKVAPCISASKKHDVSISGEGIIDGNGKWWRPVKRGKVSDTEWKAFKRMGGTMNGDESLWYPFGLKHYEDIAPSYTAQEKMRTHLIRINDCERVSVSGVIIQNAPKFHLVPQRCSDVTIKDVFVRCPWNAQNGDGIDIMQCVRVLISGCTVDVGDDGICLKGGVGQKGLDDGPCKDILIENNIVFHAHGGFVIGSEFSGGMQNIVVRNNVFSGTDTGLRFKSAPERGGLTQNIRISDISMTDIGGEAIVFQTDYADRPAGRESNKASTKNSFVPEFTDIAISGVICRGCRTAIRAKGTLETVHGITVSDCVFFYTDKATDIDVPEMIKTKNVRLISY